MFYLTNDSGRFIAVRGDVNTFLVTVWEGSVMRGVRDHIERWNRKLQGLFPGMGYYAFSPADEMANPGNHVLVLFADDSFFKAFMGGVQKVDVLTSLWDFDACVRLLR